MSIPESTDRSDAFVLVGAGAGGHALLEVLLQIPHIVVLAVVDTDPEAPGLTLAREHGIEAHVGECPAELAASPEVDVLLEATGDRDVFDRLNRSRRPETVLIPASVTRVMFHLLESQARSNRELQEMKARLEHRVLERTDQLARLNFQLEKQVSEVERANSELTRLSEEKTRYLVQATHQLKAPFAAIQSYVDILLEGFAGELAPGVIEILQKVRRRCEFLTSSIAEMLELEHIKSCRWASLSREILDLHEVILRVLRHFDEQARRRRIRIETQFHPEILHVEGNREQVGEMLDNLVENAIHYSPDGSRVVIRTEKRHDGRAAVSVGDEGIGIPAGNLGKIWQEYFRCNEAVAAYEHGSGLGLAIVKRIAELHHFDITVASAPGKGSTFTVVAPLAPREGTASGIEDPGGHGNTGTGSQSATPSPRAGR